MADRTEEKLSYKEALNYGKDAIFTDCDLGNHWIVTIDNIGNHVLFNINNRQFSDSSGKTFRFLDFILSVN